MASMSPVDPRISYAELTAWPDDGQRYELYEGEAIVVPVLQPDVVWFHRDRVRLLDPDEAIDVVPDLAVEVLSRSTEMRDRGRKMRLLARYGLPEYWLIDPKRCRIEIYRNESGRFDLIGKYGDADEVKSPALAPLRFSAGQLFPDGDSR
jgi:Uma2 family endonuclease